MDLNNLGTVIIVTQADMNWLMQGERASWELPPPAGKFCRRWPLRWYRHRCAEIEARIDDEIMAGYGLLPSGYNRWVAYAIGRGWC